MAPASRASRSGAFAPVATWAEGAFDELSWDDVPSGATEAPPLAPAPSESVEPEGSPAEPDLSGDFQPEAIGDSSGADHALFEMGDGAAPVAEAEGGLLADVPDAVDEVPATAFPPGEMSPANAIRLPRASRPATKIAVGLNERREVGTARRLSGAALNLGVAGALVLVLAAIGTVYVNEGRLDWAALSPSRWAGLMSVSNGLTTSDVSNGVYETRSGGSVLYVRGRVKSRLGHRTRVQVRAEIWDGGQLVQASEAPAGSIPSVEELYNAKGRTDVQRIRRELAAAAEPLTAGNDAEFVVLFEDAPRDLNGLRVRVTARAREEVSASPR